MDDLISRQAAIEVADAVWMVTGDKNVAKVWDQLKDLPPVQSEIVRCGYCKYAEVADAQDNQDGYTCQFHRGSIWFSGSYCSWGERRTND